MKSVHSSKCLWLNRLRVCCNLQIEMSYFTNNIKDNCTLINWGRVMHICASWLTWSVPSHYLNQCWNIVNCNLRNKHQWNLNRNSYIFIQENAFENVVWKMTAILSRPQCLNDKELDRYTLLGIRHFRERFRYHSPRKNFHRTRNSVTITVQTNLVRTLI